MCCNGVKLYRVSNSFSLEINWLYSSDFDGIEHLLVRRSNMKNAVLNLLQEMRVHAGVLIGKKSLDRLVTFLCGYVHGIYAVTNNHLIVLPGFQEFVQQKYGINDHYWADIILFCCFNNDEEAFDVFYELLDEFLKLHPEIRENK